MFGSEFKRNAVCLISGGVDSVTATYYVKSFLKPGKQLLIFCNYGQRTYPYEEFCIRKISELLSVPLKIVDLRWLGEISTSVLTHPEREIPETKTEDLWDPEKARRRILRWWDPCRNAILLLIGLAHAESFYISNGERYDVYIGIRRETPVAMKDNCVTGDAKIYVVQKGNLSICSIGDFCDSFFMGSATGFVDVSNLVLYTFSMTPNGRIVQSKISHLYREKPKYMLYEFTLARPSTRKAFNTKITVTRNHDLYTVDDKGQFVTKDSAELREGDIVVVPRVLPFQGPSSGLSDSFLRFLGLWLGDGCRIDPRRPWVMISAGEDHESIDVLRSVCEEITYEGKFQPWKRGQHPSLKFDGVDVKIHSKSLVGKMIELGLTDYCEVRSVPDWIFNLPSREILPLVWGWLKSDSGYTVSKQLSAAMKTLMLRLGINAAESCVEDNHYPGSNPRPLYRIHLRYEDASRIGISETAITDSQRLVFLPANIRKALFKQLESRVRGWTSHIGFRYWEKVRFVRLSNLIEWLRYVDEYLKKWMERWLNLDVDVLVIRSVRKVPSNVGYVYDLTVPEHRNFVANDVVVHNTPEFLEEMNRLSEQATHHGGYRILAPLITYDKDQVVKLGEELGVPWIYTFSCYAGQGFQQIGGETYPIHCGICSNCRRRKLAFRDAGVRDPSVYAR